VLHVEYSLVIMGELSEGLDLSSWLALMPAVVPWRRPECGIYGFPPSPPPYTLREQCEQDLAEDAPTPCLS
jgi:hypothetical protein